MAKTDYDTAEMRKKAEATLKKNLQEKAHSKVLKRIRAYKRYWENSED